MEDLYRDNSAVEAQELQRVAKLIKTTPSQASHAGTAAGSGVHEAAMRALDNTINETSGKVLAWAEGAAAAAAAAATATAPYDEDQRKVFPPVLLTGCCRYMEALATAHPTRFSAECQSLARPVASCVLVMMENAAAAAAVPFLDANDQGELSSEREPFIAFEQQLLSADRNAATIEERKALELWVDLFGICLLPFCSSSHSSRGRRGGGCWAVSGGHRSGDDPFDSDSESEGEEEEEEEEDAYGGDKEKIGDGVFSDGGSSRSGRVAGWWMRRAGSILAEPLECPFDVRPGGQDEELPRRLAAFITAHAKAAARASRPASVSSMATVLTVLVALTAAAAMREGQEGVPSGSHLAVVEEAFACLMSLSETASESSAQAECVKVALVSLKEWVQAARLPCLERRVPALLSMLEGVPFRLKQLLTRSKSRGPKAYSTARSFCREALVAAVACSREVIGRAGGAVVADDPRWFLDKFVVKMASPLLLGDAVGALRAAAAPAAAPLSSVTAGALEGGGAEPGPNADPPSGGMGAALREEILPGAVERLTKALGNIDRYSAAAAKEVLKATAWLVRAAGGSVLPHRHRLGIALVGCANSEGRSSGGGGVGQDEKIRLCLRAIRRLGAATAGAGDGAAANPVDGSPGVSTVAGESFAEAALNLACGVVEREWVGKREEGDQDGTSNAAEESVIMLVEAHVTLATLVRSRSLRVPGIGPDGEWPATAKRLAKLAWAIAFRVRKAAGAVEASMALADDDVMLLCQGLEVLEALSECSSEFFEGSTKLLFFEGEMSPILTTLRGCHNKNTMHPVVYDACLWVESTRLS